MSGADILARGLAQRNRADLASTAAGKGASLVGTGNGATLQQRLDEIPASILGTGGIARGQSPGPAALAANTLAFQGLLDASAEDDPRMAMVPPGRWVSGKLTISTGTSTHSRTVRGAGSPRIGSRLRLGQPDPYLLDIGDGSFGTFHVKLENLALSGGDLVTTALVRFNRGNFLYVSDVNFGDFVGAKGLVLDPGLASLTPLMQEVRIANCNFMGRQDASDGFAVVCCEANVSGNVTFDCCNFEAAYTGLKVTGVDALGVINIDGGWFERIENFAIDASDAAILGRTTSLTGALWFNSGCVGSDLTMLSSGGGNFPANPTGVCDNGFANRVVRMGTSLGDPLDFGKSVGQQGHTQTGLEWTRVPGFNPNAMFEAGAASVSAATCTVNDIPSPVPGLPPGQAAAAVALRSTAAGQYAEFGPFTVTTAKDYLGLVGLLIDRNASGLVKIGLYDAAGTLLEEKPVRPMSAQASLSGKHHWRLEKVLATAIAGTTIKLRVTLLAADVYLHCWLADIKQSESRHLSDVGQSDSTSGSGAAKRYRRTLQSTAMTLNMGFAWPQGVGQMTHAMVETVTPGSGVSYIGEGGTHNVPEQRQLFRLPDTAETREWTWFVPNARTAVGAARLAAWSFKPSGHVIDLYETFTGICFPSVAVREHTASLGASGSANVRQGLWLPTKGQRGLIMGLRFAFEMTADVAQDAANYLTVALKKRSGTGAAIALWSKSSNASAIATVAPTDVALSSLYAATTPMLLRDSDKLFLEITPTGATPPAFTGTVMVSVLVRDFLPGAN